VTKDTEEFEKLRKRLYALADKMGQRITIIVRRKNPFTKDAPGKREPGEE
jgi:hypothetical protein